MTDLRYYHGEDVRLDFMWSDSMAEALQDLFFGQDFAPPKDCPMGHPGGCDTIDGVSVDWHLPCVRKDVVIAASFTSDIRYDVTGTLHVYGG